MNLEEFLLQMLRKSAINLMAGEKAPELEDVRKSIENAVRLYWGDSANIGLEADTKGVRVFFSSEKRSGTFDFTHRRIFCMDRWIGVRDVWQEA